MPIMIFLLQHLIEEMELSGLIMVAKLMAFLRHIVDLGSLFSHLVLVQVGSKD